MSNELANSLSNTFKDTMLPGETVLHVVTPNRNLFLHELMFAWGFPFIFFFLLPGILFSFNIYLFLFFVFISLIFSMVKIIKTKKLRLVITDRRIVQLSGSYIRAFRLEQIDSVTPQRGLTMSMFGINGMRIESNGDVSNIGPVYDGSSTMQEVIKLVEERRS